VLSQDLTQANRTAEIELCSAYFVIDDQARELVDLQQSHKALKQKQLKENNEWADLLLNEVKKWQSRLSHCRSNLKIQSSSQSSSQSSLQSSPQSPLQSSLPPLQFLQALPPLQTNMKQTRTSVTHCCQYIYSKQHQILTLNAEREKQSQRQIPKHFTRPPNPVTQL